VSDVADGATNVLPLYSWQRESAASLVVGRAHWPHALLLTGPQGIGKRALAHYLGQALLCEQPNPDGSPCGACASCSYVANGQHPDLRVIEPLQYDDDGNAARVDAIVVDRIRELIEFVQLTSHRRGAKLALIYPAETMNTQAANALLKTLEEPPAGTHLLLVSHQPGRLPATILSRCQIVRAPRPAREEATAWLAGEGIEAAARVLAQAGGAPLLALGLAEPAVQREAQVLLAELARPERLSPVSVGARLDAAARDERKSRLADAVYWLLTWTADLAAVSGGGEPRFHPEHADALRRLATRVAKLPLFRYYQSLLRQRGLLGHPLQPRLVVESLLFEYRLLFTRGS
jgi:DNA polymerase-3 subunit delta'